MLRICVLLVLCATALLGTPDVYALGEDVLAATGQYTFFIKPRCGPNATYYQKMVPCVITEECPIPVPVVDRYGVPYPDTRKQRVTRHEIPLGCALGQKPCIDCFPKPSRVNGFRDVVVPGNIPVAIGSYAPKPNTTVRPIMLPQWFAVYEDVKDAKGRIRPPQGCDASGRVIAGRISK